MKRMICMLLCAVRTGFLLTLPAEPERVAVMSDTMIEATLASGACVRSKAAPHKTCGAAVF